VIIKNSPGIPETIHLMGPLHRLDPPSRAAAFRTYPGRVDRLVHKYRGTLRYLIGGLRGILPGVGPLHFPW